MIFAGSRPRSGALWFVAALLALAPAGCDDGPAGTPAVSEAAVSETPTPAETTKTTAPKTTAPKTTAPRTTAPSPGAENEAVTLVRSGGLAGLAETIKVQPDGRWKLATGRGTERTGRLSAAQVSRLQALVADPRLAAEADRSLSRTSGCRDAFTYLLMADHELVKYEECPGQDEQPKVTMEIIALLRNATGP